MPNYQNNGFPCQETATVTAAAAIGYSVELNNNQASNNQQQNMNIRRHFSPDDVKHYLITFCWLAYIGMLIGSAISHDYMNSMAANKIVGFEVDSLGLDSLTIVPNNDPNHPNQYVLNSSLNLTLSMMLKRTTTVDSPFLVLLEYQGVVFSSTTVQLAVYQHSKNQTLELQMDAAPELPQGIIDTVAKDLATSDHELEFTVHVRGSDWIFDGYHLSDRHYSPRVECNGVKVRFQSLSSTPSSDNITTATNGNVINAPIHCSAKCVQQDD